MPGFLDKLAALEALYDDLLDDDVAGLPGAVLVEAMSTLGRVRNKHAALDVTATAAFDASKEWMADGSRSAAAWLQAKGHERKGVPQRRVRLGRALRAMPVTERAFAAGEITAEHVERLGEVRRGLEEVFADSERRLVGHAKKLRFVQFDRKVRYWQDVADPDGADERAHKQTAGAYWHASRSFEDMVCAGGWLDPIGGAVYLRELERLEKHLFEQDWAEAVARLGARNVTAADLRRTPAQRRAAAQVWMAERSSTLSLSGVSSLRPILNLVMDWPTFCAELARREGRTDVRFPDERTCRLDDGTIITPSQALSLGLAGLVRRQVLGPDGVVLDYGQAVRLIPDDIRTCVQLTEDFCTHDAGCDVPSWLCEMDHITPFTDGGPTSLINAQPHCKPHNRHKETLDRKERIKRRRANARRRAAGGDDAEAEVA